VLVATLQRKDPKPFAIVKRKRPDVLQLAVQAQMTVRSDQPIIEHDDGGLNQPVQPTSNIEHTDQTWHTEAKDQLKWGRILLGI
jgi:hypothetical protein